MRGVIAHCVWGPCAWLGPLCIMRGAIAHYVWGHSPLHIMYGTIAHHAWGHCVLCMEPLHIMHGAIAHHSWAIVHDAWGHCTWCMWPLPIMHGPLCSIRRANALCACMKTLHSTRRRIVCRHVVQSKIHEAAILYTVVQYSLSDKPWLDIFLRLRCIWIYL